MDKILFILNPVAGRGVAKDLDILIDDVMKSRDEEYRIVYTEKPREAIGYSKDALRGGYDIVVAVGGDGTINEVAKPLIGSSVKLGIIPAGTGNDMARTLGIPLEPRRALDIVLEKNFNGIDVGLVNDHIFLNISSAGLDSQIVNTAKKYKDKYGGMAYIISLFETLFKYKKKHMYIDIDGETIEEEIYLIAVGNGNTYGGGLNILPMAKVDDGELYVCIVKGLNLPQILFLLPSIAFGKHILFKKYVSVYMAKEVNISTDEEVYLNVDGEIFRLEEETEFKLHKEKLNIIY